MIAMQEKVVLVTGGGMGIGRAIAQRFGEVGACVIVSDVNEADGKHTAHTLQKSGCQAHFMPADVSDPGQVKDLVRHISSRFGRLDAAVNNAGISGPMSRTHDIDEGTFGRIVDVNLKGVFLCMKHELALMLERRCGSIVNIASVAGVVGEVNFAAYSATKHGVVGLTKTAALEYARDGIRVNALCPGVIRTPMIEAVQRDLGEAQMQAFIDAKQPMGRMGEPGEVADAAVWLCSGASSLVTGQAIGVDGGYLAQ